MFTANDESVLVSFQALCEQYPRENVITLWEMAGGTTMLALDSATALRAAASSGAS